MTAALAYQLLSELPASLQEELDESGHSMTRPQAVMVLQAIRDARRELYGFEKDIEQLVVELSGKERQFAIDGVGAVEIKKRQERKHWQSHDLIRLLVARALDERQELADGTYESDGVAVARVLEECARQEWRLTPLRARRIPVDEYCETEDAGYSVRVAS
jgi:hypothetical protein